MRQLFLFWCSAYGNADLSLWMFLEICRNADGWIYKSTPVRSLQSIELPCVNWAMSWDRALLHFFFSPLDSEMWLLQSNREACVEGKLPRGVLVFLHLIPLLQWDTRLGPFFPRFLLIFIHLLQAYRSYFCQHRLHNLTLLFTGFLSAMHFHYLMALLCCRLPKQWRCIGSFLPRPVCVRDVLEARPTFPGASFISCCSVSWKIHPLLYLYKFWLSYPMKCAGINL